MTRIDIKVISENPTSGARRWEVPVNHVFTIESWLEGQGKTLGDAVRGIRYRKNGSFSFVTGGGYAIFDADLLGGNGDGRAESKFESDTGYTLFGV